MKTTKTTSRRWIDDRTWAAKASADDAVDVDVVGNDDVENELTTIATTKGERPTSPSSSRQREAEAAGKRARRGERT